MTPYLGPESGAVISGESITEDLHIGPVVHARYALHEVRGGVVTKVRAHVSNTQPTYKTQVIVLVLYPVGTR